jgi:predicted nuclease with TOPRIM domain
MNVEVPQQNSVPIQVSTDDLLNTLQEVYGQGLATSMGEQARFKAGLSTAQSMLTSMRGTIEALMNEKEELTGEVATLRSSLDQAMAANTSLQAANERLADENDKLRDEVHEALPEAMKED